MGLCFKTNEEQLCWQRYYFPFLILFSQRRKGSKEDKGRQRDKGAGTRGVGRGEENNTGGDGGERGRTD